MHDDEISGTHAARLHWPTARQIAINERFHAFARGIDLGQLGSVAATNYKLPCVEPEMKKPWTRHRLGRGPRDKMGETPRGQWVELSSRGTVFGMLDQVVTLHCQEFGLWAIREANDTPEQAQLRTDWKSIMEEWRAVARQNSRT